MSSSPAQICPACGRAVEPEASFCEVCGAELHAEVAEVESHAEAAEVESHAEVAEVESHAKVAEVESHAEVAEVESHAEVAEVESHAEVAEAAEVGSHAEVAEVGSHAEVAEVGSHAGVAETAKPKAPAEALSTPAQSVFDAASMLRPDLRDEVPFELEWDGAREFIEGESGTFAFRFRALYDLASVCLEAIVGEKPLSPVEMRNIAADGGWLTRTLDYVPNRNGRISVRLRATIRQRDRVTEETFESRDDFEHRIQPRDAMAYYGPDSVQPTIRNSISNEPGGSSGIVRNDGRYAQTVNVGVPGAVFNRLEFQDRVLGRGPSFRPVAFSPSGIERERAVLRAPGQKGIAELLVIPGTSRIQFGRSRSSVDVRLVPETTDACADEMRTNFVSNVHFAVCRDAGDRYVLRDGGIYKGSAWRSSTNGLNVDGEPLRAKALPLVPNHAEDLVLAPYAVSGGALSLTLEPRGWDDPAAAGCADRPGNLASLLVRRGDNPHKAILVVWGAAALDPILGTRSGLRIASLCGRLHVADRAGRVRRLSRLSGRSLSGTGWTVL